MVITSVAKRVWTGGPYNKNKLMAWWFKFSYNYGWDGRQYGLHYHDGYYEPAPEVQEALRRYRLADPYGYDLRHQRILRATHLVMNHERLPKSEWTKMEDDTWYLGPFIDEIENEKVERTYTSGLKPGYQLKQQL